MPFAPALHNRLILEKISSQQCELFSFFRKRYNTVMIKKTKTMPKFVGYSLAGFCASLFVFAFFWCLNFFYNLVIYINDDMYIRFQSFFNCLSLVLLLVMGFTFLPPLVYGILTIGSFLARNSTNRKSFLKKIAREKHRIIYYTSVGYWFLYIISMAGYSIFYLIKK